MEKNAWHVAKLLVDRIDHGAPVTAWKVGFQLLMFANVADIQQI